MYPRWLSISLSMRELSGAAASPSLETLLLSSSGPSRRIEEGSRTGGRRRTRGVGGIRHAERRPHHRGADRLGALVRARGGQRCPRDLSGHQGAHGALRPERQSVDDHIDMAVRIGVLAGARTTSRPMALRRCRVTLPTTHASPSRAWRRGRLGRSHHAADAWRNRHRRGAVSMSTPREAGIDAAIAEVGSPTCSPIRVRVRLRRESL